MSNNFWIVAGIVGIVFVVLWLTGNLGPSPFN